jgi:hypothetical protein
VLALQKQQELLQQLQVASQQYAVLAAPMAACDMVVDFDDVITRKDALRLKQKAKRMEREEREEHEYKVMAAAESAEQVMIRRGDLRTWVKPMQLGMADLRQRLVGERIMTYYEDEDEWFEAAVVDFVDLGSEEARQEEEEEEEEEEGQKGQEGGQQQEVQEGGQQEGGQQQEAQQKGYGSSPNVRTNQHHLPDQQQQLTSLLYKLVYLSDGVEVQSINSALYPMHCTNLRWGAGGGGPRDSRVAPDVGAAEGGVAGGALLRVR